MSDAKYLGMTANKIATIAASLEVENAKLRELANKLIIFAFARCSDCDLLVNGCFPNPTHKCLLWIECESLARELGVEVDDGF